jgi:hypothetical protein
MAGIIAANAVPASAEVSISALMSVVARQRDAAIESHRTNFGITPYDAAYARIFLDAAVSDRLSAFLQWFAHDYEGAFFYGAYVRYDHTPNTHLEAGLIPVPVGLWPPRTYADKNPLVSVPAIYQYKTALDGYGELQRALPELLGERGQSAHAPVLYDFCWNTGIHGYASYGDFDFGVAVLNGSLGMPRREVVYSQPAAAAHVNWVPSAYLTLGGWAAAGPWMSPHFESDLPAGEAIEDYEQLTAGGLLQAAAGHAEVNAECVINRFEHPYFGNLDNLGGYADLTYSFLTRWWTAIRFDALTFSEIDEDLSAERSRWDYPFVRVELGLGRRLAEHARLKAVAQFIRFQDAPAALDGEVYALQLTVRL